MTVTKVSFCFVILCLYVYISKIDQMSSQYTHKNIKFYFSNASKGQTICNPRYNTIIKSFIALRKTSKTLNDSTWRNTLDNNFASGTSLSHCDFIRKSNAFGLCVYTLTGTNCRYNFRLEDRVVVIEFGAVFDFGQSGRRSAIVPASLLDRSLQTCMICVSLLLSLVLLSEHSSPLKKGFEAESFFS